MVSVDEPEASARLKATLQLPGVLLSDARREVLQRWNLLNPRERGGVAIPSVFVLDTDRTVLAYAVYSMTNRVPASDIVRFLERRDSILSLRRVRLTLAALWHSFTARKYVSPPPEA